MSNSELIVLNNEKVSKKGNVYYSRNYNLKILPEGLNNFFNVKYIARKSNVEENHKMNFTEIKISSNIFQFIYFVFSTFKNKNAKYFIISISPYTFIAFIFLFVFRKKIYLYLISSGYEEWRYILGSWSIWVYHLMYKIMTSNSTVITLHDKLVKQNEGYVINSSSLNDSWLSNIKNAELDKIKFLYIGRINPEKGIYEFLKMFKKIEFDSEITIIGKAKNLIIQKRMNDLIQNNPRIKFQGVVSNREKLKEIYDEHNIFILPSFTEGQPCVVDEALARRRPVLIFENISHIIKDRKGIFVSQRSLDSFTKITKYIMQNYEQIQSQIKKNKLTLEKDMFKDIVAIINR